MIAQLRGRLAHRAADHAVIDVHGVGYQVFVPAGLVLAADRDLTLYISTIVREDAFLLYGFDSPESREAFDLVRQVNGVGPRIALGLLGALPVDELSRAVASKDVRALTAAPGVGKKLAERLCLELESKIPRTFRPVERSSAPSPEDPLPLALARLEYKKSEIDVALNADSVPKFGAAPLEDRLRAALAVLARPR